jgi:hypothetical protein
MPVEEVAMQWQLLSGPRSGEIRKRRSRILLWLAPAAVVFVPLTLGSFAQMQQPPSHPPKPLIDPVANPTPDPNDQMQMRQRTVRMHNFDAANAERLRQMMKASDMLETLAIALKVEVDQSGQYSPNELQKAENIEKLARIVKDRMKLTVAPQ